MDADQLLRDGDLDGARSALVETVRSHPQDARARMFLFQLLAVAGEWDKARTHLETLARISPEAQMLATVYSMAMKAEAQRAAIFAGRERMPVIRGAWAEGLADAIMHYANGRTAEGDAARDEALDHAPDTPGEIDGVRFDWITDADARFGPTFEVIVQGRYGLVAFSEVAHVKSEGPRDLRDTVWYPVQLAFREGQSVAALVPTRYPGSELSNDLAMRMGRSTGWQAGAAGETGCGQHLLGLSGGEEVGLLALRSLAFDQA
jgi:protein involved in temperature-dependent protein secretion